VRLAYCRIRDVECTTDLLTSSGSEPEYTGVASDVTQPYGLKAWSDTFCSLFHDVIVGASNKNIAELPQWRS